MFTFHPKKLKNGWILQGLYQKLDLIPEIGLKLENLISSKYGKTAVQKKFWRFI